MSDDNLSMPFDDGDSESSDESQQPSMVADSFETGEGVGTEPSTDDVSLDMPVAATTELGDDDPAMYGTRRDELQAIGEEDGTSDEVDVRKLFDKPTVDYIRWQYRQNGMASTVVDKPVKDAFKHSFEIHSTEDDIDTNTFETVTSWVHETYVPRQKEARIKARRDGVAVLFYVYDDASDVSSPVDNPSEIADLRVLTIDELANGGGNPRYSDRKRSFKPTAQEAAEHVEYDASQLVVTRSGIVVVDDITSVDHEDFVGVMYERNPHLADEDEYEFIHADRLDIFVERPTVDGDLDDLAYGHVEGDSVLAPIIHALTGITKAEWALGQTLLRYTAPLHVVEIDSDATPKDGDWESHIDSLNEQLDNVNNKSSLTLPPAHTGKTLSADTDIDPEPFLDGLINDICAGSEITRSVLLGTQSGTVSGSSTDIKNYFNQVQRYRRGTAETKIHDAVHRKAEIEGMDHAAVEVEWGPLFRVDDLQRVDAMRTVVNAVSELVSNYIVSHEDAQQIIREQWAELGGDVEMGELDEEDFDLLDRINTRKDKQYGSGEGSEREFESKHLGNNGGGREQGQSNDPSNPTTDRHGRSESKNESEAPSDPTTEG